MVSLNLKRAATSLGMTPEALEEMLMRLSSTYIDTVEATAK